jgi:DnaJ-class molecular chaperone
VSGETKIEKSTPTCPNCKGCGTKDIVLYLGVGGRHNRYEHKRVVCPTCKGTGIWDSPLRVFFERASATP